GWKNYFQLGYPAAAFRDINAYVHSRLKQHLRRRSQRPYRPPEDVTYYSEPPLLIHLVRGHTSPPYQQAQARINVFAMKALSGPVETWRIEAHESFASIEDTQEALARRTDRQLQPPSDYLSAELLGDARGITAIYRPTLSYRPDQAIRQFGRARYFYVTVHRVRTGTTSDFSDLLRLRKEGLDDMNLDRPELAYQVIAGGPSGTYLLLAPLPSLKILDDGLAKRAYQADPGAGGSKGEKVAQSEIVRSHLIFRVEPSLSYVSDEFAAEWPDFWRRSR
ncbi:MAG: hypothetical protein HY820_21230, partial [Acidobacteria bacterium]|nr:hypothetical protein [Acidobacteriota bacterium]